MKLPPNRTCINCKSLGSQHVSTKLDLCLHDLRGTTRTTPLGSTYSNPSSVISYNSENHTIGINIHQVKAFESLQVKVSTIRQRTVPAISVSLDLSEPPLASEPLPSSTPSVDLVQLPASSGAPLMDLIQPCVLSSVPSLTENKPSCTSQPS